MTLKERKCVLHVLAFALRLWGRLSEAGWMERERRVSRGSPQPTILHPFQAKNSQRKKESLLRPWNNMWSFSLPRSFQPREEAWLSSVPCWPQQSQEDTLLKQSWVLIKSNNHPPHLRNNNNNILIARLRKWEEPFEAEVWRKYSTTVSKVKSD